MERMQLSSVEVHDVHSAALGFLNDQPAHRAEDVSGIKGMRYHISRNSHCLKVG
jgi:hypothetical protein